MRKNFQFFRQRRISLWLTIFKQFSIFPPKADFPRCCGVNNFQYRQQRGQVVLVVMLVSAVVLTLGLSVSKRTVTETKIDADEALLKEAFNAAESGVDYYLGTGETKYSSTGVKADIEVTPLGGAAIDSGEYVMDKRAAFFWLAARDTNGNLLYTPGNYFEGASVDICKDSNNLTSGTFKIDFYYKSGTAFKVKRWMHNFGGGAVSGVNNILSPATRCGDGIELGLGLAGGEVPVLITVTPIGGGTKIYMKGGSNFPVQGEEISSTGKAGDIEGNTGVSRRVRVINRYDELPLFMLETMTAAGSVY